MAAYLVPLCRHCNKARVNRPRGLCWNCYYRPGVRDAYPVLPVKQNNRGRADFNGPTALPVPTDTLPTTDDKIEVMRRRAACGLSLHHPDDARMDTK